MPTISIRPWTCADRFARLAEQPRNLVSPRDIAGERMSADFMGDVLRKIRIAVHTTHFRTGLGDGVGDLTPYAIARTEHDKDAAA